MRGLDPTLKSARLANYLTALRMELLKLSHSCGVEHPHPVTSDHVEIVNDHFGSSSVESVLGFDVPLPRPSDEAICNVRKLMNR